MTQDKIIVRGARMLPACAGFEIQHKQKGKYQIEYTWDVRRHTLTLNISTL